MQCLGACYRAGVRARRIVFCVVASGFERDKCAALGGYAARSDMLQSVNRLSSLCRKRLVHSTICCYIVASIGSHICGVHATMSSHRYQFKSQRNEHDTYLVRISWLPFEFDPCIVEKVLVTRMIYSRCNDYE